jgi:hypothetical protein
MHLQPLQCLFGMAFTLQGDCCMDISHIVVVSSAWPTSMMELFCSAMQCARRIRNVERRASIVPWHQVESCVWFAGSGDRSHYCPSTVSPRRHASKFMCDQHWILLSCQHNNNDEYDTGLRTILFPYTAASDDNQTRSANNIDS